MPKAPSRNLRKKNIVLLSAREIVPTTHDLCIHVDGIDKPFTLDLTEWPGSEQMHLELVPAIEGGFGPQGGWRSHSTLLHVRTHAAHILSFAHKRGVESFAQFTPELWDEYLRIGNNQRITIVRALMQRVHALPTDTQARIRRRFTKIRAVDTLNDISRGLAGSVTSNTPNLDEREYTRAELETIEASAQRVLSQAASRIEQHSALVHSGAQTEPALSLRAMLSGGPVPTSIENMTNMPENVRTATLHRILPTREEATAFAALLVIKEGFNLSTILRLRVPQDSASIGDRDGFVLLESDKPRRGPANRHAQNVLEVRKNGASGSIVKRWIRATQAARLYLQFYGTPTDSLFLYAGIGGNSAGSNSLVADGVREPIRTSLSTGARRSWSKPWWLPGTMRLNFQKLHRSAVAVLNRGATHNTRNTFITEYLTKSPTALANAHQGALKAQEYALGRATERLRLPLLQSNTVPDGSSETATVSCLDYSHHPDTNIRCTDSFLACLTCTNAVAVPMHLPRLCYLREALNNRRSITDNRDWNSWSEHFWNLEAFLRTVAGLSEEQIKSQSSRATQKEQEHVRRILGGTYDAP